MITFNQHFPCETSFNDIILVVKSDLGADLRTYSFNLNAERGAVTVHLKYFGRGHLNREQVGYFLISCSLSYVKYQE